MKKNLKKLFSVAYLLMIFFSNGISVFAQTASDFKCSDTDYNLMCCGEDDKTCVDSGVPTCTPATQIKCCDASDPKKCVNPTCSDEKLTYKDGSCYCEGVLMDGECIVNNYGDMGIECSSDQLINGQCKLNIYKTIGIRQGNEDQDPKDFIQDLINGVTMFIGTVVTVVLVYSGFMYVYSGVSGQDSSNYKKGIIKGLIGILIVGSSYAIIRLVQFLAKGG